MAETYKLTFGRRLVNRIVQALLRAGVKIGTTYLLTVKGRKSGQMHTIPVTLVEEGSQRWLVAPYGEVSWVRNARAAGQVTLTRGRQSETVAIVELGPADAAPVLREYLKRVPIVHPFFDATSASPLEVFESEASLHPVFRIIGST